MAAIRLVTFWLNAFIPAHIPGYTILVPKGPHRGKTMIPGPWTTSIGVDVGGVPLSSEDFVRGLSGRPYRARTRRFGADAVGFSDCYLTDQRSFSNAIDAKSRMHSQFSLDLSGSEFVFTQEHHCDATIELDCENGCVECKRVGSTDRMKFTLEPSTSGGPRNRIVVKMDCASSNPCDKSSRLFGDIDYSGTITFDVNTREIEFVGKIDQFPAFEAYAAVNDGAGVSLIQESPPRGNSVLNLPGFADRPVQGNHEF